MSEILGPPPRRYHVIAGGLDQALAGIAPWLAETPDFALMGGTALSEFYLGHRPSDDLDFFTLDPRAFDNVVRDLPAILGQAFPSGRIVRERSGPTFARFRVDSAVALSLKIEIIRDVPPRFGPVHVVEGVSVGSLLDIAEGKLQAFVSRREGKDAIDLWALQNLGGVPLLAIYPLAYQKDLGLAQFPMSIAESLHAASVSPPLMPPMLVDVTPRKVQDFFVREYDRFIREGLPPAV